MSEQKLHDINLELFERRRQRIEQEMRQIQVDAEHWNRNHPDEEPIIIEPVTAAEIERAKAKRGE